MFTKINMQKLLVLTLAMQLFIACQPKSRDKAKTPQKAPAAQDAKDSKSNTQSSPAGQEIKQTIGDQTSSKKDSAADKKNETTEEKTDKKNTTSPAVVTAPKAEEKANEQVEAAKKQEGKKINENLFANIAVDEKQCQDQGIKVIRFNDNEKTSLIIAPFFQGDVNAPLNRYAVLKVNDKNDVDSVVVSDVDGSQGHSLLMIDARLNIEKSRPNQVRIAMSGQSDLVGEVNQLTKDDQLAKQICRQIQLNPLSLIVKSNVLLFSKATKNKTFRLIGNLVSQQKVISEVKLQLTKDLKAAVQLGDFSQVYEFSYADSKDVLVKIGDLGEIHVVNNLLKFDLHKKITVKKPDAAKGVGPAGSRLGTITAEQNLVFEAGQTSVLSLKYSDN